MKKNADPNPELDAIAITALAKSQKAEKCRDLLDPGMHHCCFSVVGTIDKQKWAKGINGILTIAPDSAPVASSSTPWSDLLQSALCMVTEKNRRGFLATIGEGRIPVPDCSAEKLAAVAAEIEPALVGYRSAHPIPKRGTVTFTPTAEVPL